MERTSRKQLDSLVYQLNVRLNRPLTRFKTNQPGSRMNIGHFMLDHNPSYGGYQLVEIDNESGGERTHFSGRRFSAQEMWWMLYAIREVIIHNEFKVWPAKAA